MPLKLVLTMVGTTGDVRPFVALALRLRAAGHRVRVCSHDLYRSWFDEHGLDFVPLGAPVTERQIRDTARRAAAARSPFRQVEILQEFHLQAAGAHYADCWGATSGFDLAVCHTIHSLGQAAVLDNGLPWIGVRFEPSLVPTAYAPPQGMPDLGRRLNPLLWRLVERGMARIDRVLDEQLARLGSQQRGLSMFRALSPLLNLVACSPSIAALYPDRPATVRFTGAWTVDEPAAELPAALESFLQARPPPVVLSFGSMAGGRSSSVEPRSWRPAILARRSCWWTMCRIARSCPGQRASSTMAGRAPPTRPVRPAYPAWWYLTWATSTTGPAACTTWVWRATAFAGAAHQLAPG